MTSRYVGPGAPLLVLEDVYVNAGTGRISMIVRVEPYGWLKFETGVEADIDTLYDLTITNWKPPPAPGDRRTTPVMSSDAITATTHMVARQAAALLEYVQRHQIKVQKEA